MPVHFREYPIIKGKDAARFISRRNLAEKYLEARARVAIKKIVLKVSKG